MKQICPIHRFSYSGEKCPFCEQERLERLSQRYVAEDHLKYKHKKQERYDKPITEDDLKEFTAKFVVIDHLNVLGNYKHKTNNDIDITEEQLKKLTEKFNVKRK